MSIDGPAVARTQAPVTCRLLPAAELVSPFHSLPYYAASLNLSQKTARRDSRISVVSLSGALR